MKTLFQQIEAGTLPMQQGLIIVAVILIVVVAISYLLPEVRSVKR